MDIKYAAGFFDGEGCVAFHKGPRTDRAGGERYRFGAQVTNTYLPILESFQARWGGSITIQQSKKYNPKWRNAAIWRVNGQLAEDFLMELLPHLVEKRDQAEAALSFRYHRAQLPHHLSGVDTTRLDTLAAFAQDCKHKETVLSAN